MRSRWRCVSADRRTGARRYERKGERNGTKSCRLTGPTEPVELTVPRGVLQTAVGDKGWTAKIVPRYESVVNIKALRALAPRAYARPQAITPPSPARRSPAGARRHSTEGGEVCSLAPGAVSASRSSGAW